MMFKANRFLRGLLAPLAILLIAGCATDRPLLSSSMRWLSGNDSVHMSLLLSPSRFEEAGGKATQGMLCRVYFFVGEDPIPQKVEGSIEFAAYDRSIQGENVAPVGLYRISEEELAAHMRTDVVGPSYVFWLPYDPPAATQVVIQSAFVGSKKKREATAVAAMELQPVDQSSASAEQVASRAPDSRYRRSSLTVIEQNARKLAKAGASAATATPASSTPSTSTSAKPVATDPTPPTAQSPARATSSSPVSATAAPVATNATTAASAAGPSTAIPAPGTGAGANDGQPRMPGPLGQLGVPQPIAPLPDAALRMLAE